jgi:hypothetical protein
VVEAAAGAGIEAGLGAMAGAAAVAGLAVDFEADPPAILKPAAVAAASVIKAPFFVVPYSLSLDGW